MELQPKIFVYHTKTVRAGAVFSEAILPL